MVHRLVTFGVVGILFLTSYGCEGRVEARKVNLDRREAVSRNQRSEGKPEISIAVGSMITPKAGYAYYRRLLDYIGEKVGRRVRFVDQETYGEMNSMMERGELDVAFVCGRPYVDGHDAFGMELLAAPLAYGQTRYYSYVIVPSDSPAESLEDLRGKTFAFADPMSNSGKLAPTFMLAKIGETPLSFFSKYIYTYAHDESIKAVAQKVVDGAAVDSLIYEFDKKNKPEIAAATKIIARSDSHGIPPVVARPALDPELKEQVKSVLLRLHESREGQEILDGMMIDKFVPIEDSEYDSIREMKAFVEQEREQG